MAFFAESESRPGDEPGPRERPVTGYRSIAAATGPDEEGGKLRIRAESCADYYSQARLFFRSLAEPEQAHLASALVFELSKVGLPHVRTRMMANLVNVDPTLAKRVADWLTMGVPKASPTAAPVKVMELSPALRIIEGPLAPKSIEGRTIAILIADGSDAGAVDELTSKIGGARMSDGPALEADSQLAGGPSVLFDGWKCYSRKRAVRSS